MSGLEHAPVVAWCVVLAVSVSGCAATAPPGHSGDPCELDRFGCEVVEFNDDPSCQLDGALELELGDGNGEFRPFSPEEIPEISFGAQGGQHTLVGVRVGGADLDRYSALRLRIGLYGGSACGGHGMAENLTPCDEPATAGERIVVLGADEPLTALESGLVEETNLLLFVGALYEEHMVLQGIVEDPCGRLGLTQHLFAGDPI